MKLREFTTEEKATRQRLDPKCWTGKKIGNPKTKVKGGVRVNNCVPAESVTEMDKSQTPPGRDGGNDEGGKKEYTAKPTTAKKVAKDAEKVLNKELNKKQGVAEGFPHDVDHMPGPVIRNADMTTDNVKTKDKAEWDRATDSINARVFDDMSEFRTDSKGETVVGDSAVWAKWDNATQTGWFNAKGRPLKPWPIKEQGVAEEFNPEYDDEAGMAHGSLHTLKNAVEGLMQVIDDRDNLPEWCQEKISLAEDYLVTVWDYLQSEKAQGMDPEIDEMYEAMDQLAEEMAVKNGVTADLVWEQFEAMDDRVLYETAAWRRKEGKSKKGGLNAKGVASYRRENPGSKLQMAVTTKPSKLKPGSKAAKRRKSFCARMSGVKGPMKKPNGKPTRKALALRKWNC